MTRLPKEMALAQDYLTTYGPERSAFIVRHAVEAAKAVDFPMQTFGGTRNFLPQALAAWEGRVEADEAKREADARSMTSAAASARSGSDDGSWANSAPRCPTRPQRH